MPLQSGFPCELQDRVSAPTLSLPALWTVLEITVGHWPFSDQFQHLADQNPFWSAKFTIHFQWDGN